MSTRATSARTGSPDDTDKVFDKVNDVAAADRRPQASRLRYALILGSLTAIGPLSVDMYLPALPAMAGDLHSSDAVLQLTLAAFLAGMGAGQLVAGPLADALGRRKPLLIGLSLYIVASVFCVLSPSAEVLVTARAVQSLGAATAIVIARAAVRDLYSGIAMARFFSMLMLVTGLAPILAPVIGGQMLNWTSWRGVFAALTIFGALLLIVCAFALPEPLPAHLRRPARIGGVLRTYGGLLTDRVFLGYSLTVGFLFATLFAYIAGSSFVLQGVYGLSPQVYGIVFGMNGVGLMIASQVNGRLVGRVSQRGMLRTGLVSAVAATLMMIAATTLGLGLVALLVPLLVAVSTMGLVMPNANSLALADHPDKAGSASALMGVMQFLIGGSLSPLVGIAGEDTAVPMAMLMATFAVLALLSYLVLAVPRRRIRTSG